MKYINIVPIFNQAAPYIWSTFAHIQSDAMHAVYRYETTPEEMAFNISELNTSWHRFRSHFAFAAYDGDKMVGCVDGIIQNKVAGIHGLYVLPTYHKMGIGDRLLAASEHAASVHTNMMELTALNRATYIVKISILRRPAQLFLCFAVRFHRPRNAPDWRRDMI